MIEVYRGVRYNITEEESKKFRFSAEYWWIDKKTYMGAKSLMKVRKAVKGLELKIAGIHRNDGKLFKAFVMGNMIEVDFDVYTPNYKEEEDGE